MKLQIGIARSLAARLMPERPAVTARSVVLMLRLLLAAWLGLASPHGSSALPSVPAAASRPPWPYSRELVPPLILFPEPLTLTHGSADLTLSPEATRYTLLHAAATSPIIQRSASRYLNGSGLVFPWGPRPPSHGGGGLLPDEFIISLDVDSADEELQHGVDESYTIEVSADARTAKLHAPTVWGCLRSLETFSQLVVPVDRAAGGGYVLPMAPWQIADKPEHPWRGLM